MNLKWIRAPFSLLTYGHDQLSYSAPEKGGGFCLKRNTRISPLLHAIVIGAQACERTI